MGNTIKNYILLISLALIWGSSFILMKRGLEVFDFIEVALLRIVFAFIVLFPFILRSLSHFRRRHFLPILAASLFGNGIPAFLFTKAQTELDSSLVGMLNSSVPLFTLILSVCFFGSRVSKENIYGILLGLFGVCLLSLETIQLGFVFNSYVFFVLFATICYALSINVIKQYLYDLDAYSISALAFLIIGPFAIVLLFNTDFLFNLENESKAYEALFYIMLLAVLGTALASIFFNKLLSRSSAIFTSSITYLIPIVAIFWGLYDGEAVTLIHILSIFIILSGVYLVNKRQ